MHAEPLGKGVSVLVNDQHHFTTDTILLADFASVKKHERVVELGTGCGTIPLLMIRDGSVRSLTALDIQREAIEMLKESITLNKSNGIESAACISPVLGDLRNIRDLMPAGETDLVVCNPPYKLSGAGVLNPDESKVTARHEAECTLCDICEAARWLLRSGGRFVMCQRPERLTDVLTTLRQNDLEPKRLRMVQGRAEKAPKLVLIEAKRGAKQGYLDVLPTLIVEDENGFTQEMCGIYGCYQEGRKNG